MHALAELLALLAPRPARPAAARSPPPARCSARPARARCRGCAGRAARAAGCRAIAEAGCPAAGAAFALAWAPLAYEGVARDLVQALKFRGALPVARLMAAQLAAALPPALRGVDAVVPVPPHPGRRRRRGFDPADALARALAPRLELPLAPCLSRGGGRRQVGTGVRQRRDPGRLAVRVSAPPPSRVLLVDDVHTTGATLDACARALAAAGSGWIVAATYARTL